MNIKLVIILSLLGALLGGFFLLRLQPLTAVSSKPLVEEASSHSAEHKSDMIAYTQPGLLPEGIDFSEQCQCFLVSSVGLGQIGQVTFQGEYQPFTQDETLISSFGLLVDEQRNRVLVALGDYGWGQKSSPATRHRLALLGIYDLTTGARIHRVDLAALKPDVKHLANDIAMDESGNAYITDSLAPLIYKVTPSGKASIFLEHPWLKGPSFGLNGIVFHPSGHLIVARSDNKSVYRVPLKEPAQIQKIVVSEKLPKNPDGLELLPDQKVGVIAHHTAQVVVLSSPDQWLHAKVEKRAQLTIRKPTTMVAVGENLYASESGFKQRPVPNLYRIEKVLFKD